jgi:hypothetical protein
MPGLFSPWGAGQPFCLVPRVISSGKTLWHVFPKKENLYSDKLNNRRAHLKYTVYRSLSILFMPDKGSQETATGSQRFLLLFSLILLNQD